MKKILKKILIIFMIILSLNSFLVSTIDAASIPCSQKNAEEYEEILLGNPPEETEATDEKNKEPNDSDYDEPPEGFLSAIETLITGLLGCVVGIFTYPIRIFAIFLAKGINHLTAAFAYVEGTTDPHDRDTSQRVVSPFDIFFNKIALLDINFFNFDTIKKDGLLFKFRTGIATWYYILRAIALSMLLVVLIYIGIRMAITTIASEKAKYKKMLLDWASSVAILFLLGYIISFFISLNNTFIHSVELMCNSTVIQDTYRALEVLGHKFADLASIPATVVYCILVWQTLALVISYFMRMLKLAFLILISPLITITYAIDKIGDGKAQALGAWLKEFVYTILIQPFHCIIYMVFINMSFKILLANQVLTLDRETVAAAIISILCILFVKDAEKLVKKIFNFQDDGTGTSILTGAAIATFALNKAKSVGSGTRSGINKIRANSGLIKDSAKSLAHGAAKPFKKAATNAFIAKEMRKSKKDDPGKSEDQRKKEAVDKLDERVQDKLIKKEMKKYGHKKDTDTRKDFETSLRGDYDAKVKAYKQEELDSMDEDYKKTFTDAELESMVTLKAVERIKAEKKSMLKSAKQAGHPKKKRGRILSAPRKMREIYRQSSVAQDITHAAKFVAAQGTALAVGSGIMGLTQNNELRAGFIANRATYKGAKAFLENTPQNMFNEINNNLRQTGVTTQDEAAAKIDEIIQKYETEEGTEEFKAYCDELLKALEALNLKSVKDKVIGFMRSGIKIDPTKTQQIIREALKQNGVEINESSPTYERVLHAATKVAVSLNEQEVYNKLKSGTSAGYSFDASVRRSNKTFEKNERDYESDSEAPEYESKFDSIMEDVDIENDEQLGFLMDQLEVEQAEMSSLTESQEEILRNGDYKQREEMYEDFGDDMRVLEEVELIKAEVLAKIALDVKSFSIEDLKEGRNIYGVDNKTTVNVNRIKTAVDNAINISSHRIRETYIRNDEIAQQLERTDISAEERQNLLEQQKQIKGTIRDWHHSRSRFTNVQKRLDEVYRAV